MSARLGKWRVARPAVLAGVGLGSLLCFGSVKLDASSFGGSAELAEPPRHGSRVISLEVQDNLGTETWHVCIVRLPRGRSALWCFEDAPQRDRPRRGCGFSRDSAHVRAWRSSGK
jgi:hypothetical protein